MHLESHLARHPAFAQLFLTLVESVAEFFAAAGPARRRLCALLAAFQRALLAKGPAVPLPVTYRCWDVLDDLEVCASRRARAPERPPPPPSARSP